MKIKVYLNPGRDLELIAVRFNPALDFGGIAEEVLRGHVRKRPYQFSVPRTERYVKRSLVCYVTLDEKEDKDVIEYMDSIIIAKSTFIRNIMLRSIENDINYLYSSDKLRKAIRAFEFDKKQKAERRKLKKRLERKVKDEHAGL